MELGALDDACVRSLLGPGFTQLELQVQPLRSGLVSASVLHARARYRDGHGKPRSTSFVIKALEGSHIREAAVYQHLASAGLGGFAPDCFGVDRQAGGRCNLYLEAIRPTCRWPWRNLDLAQQVLHALARLHAIAPSSDMTAALTDWNYEDELAFSAAASVIEVEAAAGAGGGVPELRPHRRALRRVVRHLPAIRKRLLEAPEIGRAVIHGDVHPGNVMIRRRQCRDVPVLLDWGRARVGSPMEDVSSWLQSLGYWESRARQRHDTLLTAYIAARGRQAARLDWALRSAYWLAAASNVLAGALRYHLHVAITAGDNLRRRSCALRAAIDGLRVIRRADAYWT